MGKQFKITDYQSLKAEKRRLKEELELEETELNIRFNTLRSFVKSKDFKFYALAKLFPEYFDGSTLVPKSLKAGINIARDLISGKVTIPKILGSILKNAFPLVPSFLSRFRR